MEAEGEASSHSLCEGGGRGAMGQGEGGGQGDTWLVGVGGDVEYYSGGLVERRKIILFLLLGIP